MSELARPDVFEELVIPEFDFNEVPEEIEPGMLITGFTDLKSFNTFEEDFVVPHINAQKTGPPKRRGAVDEWSIHHNASQPSDDLRIAGFSGRLANISALVLPYDFEHVKERINQRGAPARSLGGLAFLVAANTITLGGIVKDTLEQELAYYVPPSTGEICRVVTPSEESQKVIAARINDSAGRGQLLEAKGAQRPWSGGAIELGKHR